MRAVVLTLLIFAAFSGAQTGGNISGSIVDPSQTIIPGVRLSLIRIERTETRKSHSDSEGKFYFSDLPSGRYSLQATSPGFEKTVLTPVVVTAEHANHLPPIALKISKEILAGCRDSALPDVVAGTAPRRGTRLSGEVKTFPERGVPKNVAISLSSLSRPALRFSTRTDWAGAFVFTDIPPGLYSLVATGSGYAPFRIRSLRVRSGFPTSIVQALEMVPCTRRNGCLPVEEVHIFMLCL